MTVGEMIERLNKYNKDTNVVIGCLHNLECDLSVFKAKSVEQVEFENYDDKKYSAIAIIQGDYAGHDILGYGDKD